MVRCVVKPSQVRQGVVALEPPQVKHLVTVLRLKPGEEFLVIEEGGDTHLAALERVEGRRATARLLRPAPAPPSEPWAITLAAALPRRPGAFDQIVDDATQLGVTTIIPLLTARTVVRLEPARAATRHRRWHQLAVEAAEQAGRGIVPTVTPPRAWGDLLAQFGTFDVVLMPTVGAAPRPWDALLQGPTALRLLLLIGPEGDFTPEEVTEARQAGAHPISLGPFVLRCETAVAAALTLLTGTLRKNRSSP